MRSIAVLILGAVVLCLVTGCGASRPEVLLETELGDIRVELRPQEAPVTTANFLRYIDEDRWGGAGFYRTVRMDNQPVNPVKIEVIQGGLYEDPTGLALPPIEHETTAATGLKHLDGAFSMARAEPGTAGSEFFICIGDQPELDFGGRRNPDGQGFAVFGYVTQGMDVVRAIQSREADGQLLKDPVRILSIRRDNNPLP